MGNEYSESAGFLSNRVEFLCLKRLKENGKTYTDDSYTAAVNSGKISKAEFLNPLPNKKYGYGLVQWTTPSRKNGLYERTVAVGKSISDEQAQLEYSLYELRTSYPSVLSVLKTTNSVKTASDKVLKDFESPANWSSLSATRADYGQQYYSYFVTQGNGDSKKEVNNMTVDNAINAAIAIATGEIGYLEKASNAYLDDKTKNAGSGNYTKYWRDVYPAYQGQAWCACFVSWVFMKAFGLETAKKLLKHWPYVYCPTLGSLFTKNANPKKGDIVIFYRNGTFAHTGIVISVNGDQFTTIEGNTSGASGIIPNGGGVCKKTYYNSQLPGTKFCTPYYSLVTSVNTISNNNPLNETVKWNGYISENAAVRTWAGDSEKEVSFSPLKKNTKVGVCDTIKAKNGVDWYFIKYNNKFGFINSKQVSKEATTVSYCYVKKTTSKIRTGASAANKQTSFSPLPKGTKLQIVDTVKNKVGNKWYKIKYNNQTGYVYSGNVSLSPVDVKGTDLIVRCAYDLQATLAADMKKGITWRYRNASLNKTLALAKQNKNYYVNCVRGVQWVLQAAGLCGSEMVDLNWYGHKDGKISATTETLARLKKNFKLIKIGNKTVNQLLKDGTLQAGDVVTYVGMHHTNMYLGDNTWFDSGHAYCNTKEGVTPFTKWIGDTVYGSYKVGYIIRLKSAAKSTTTSTANKAKQYRVQTGVFGLKDNAVNMRSKLLQKGFDCLIITSGNQYITQCGVFSNKTNADALEKKLKSAGFPVAIVEI